MAEVKIYTDGAARGNPNGPGGYGVLLRFTDAAGGVHEREYSAGYAVTTNNRMELMAAIVGLEKLTKPCRVTLYSDSKYLVDAFCEDWVGYWRTHGYRNRSGQPVKNAELWQRLLEQTDRHEVTFSWVKGHDGHPENERCDRLATSAADGAVLFVDDGGDLRKPVLSTEKRESAGTAGGEFSQEDAVSAQETAVIGRETGEPESAGVSRETSGVKGAGGSREELMNRMEALQSKIDGHMAQIEQMSLSMEKLEKELERMVDEMSALEETYYT